MVIFNSYVKLPEGTSQWISWINQGRVFRMPLFLWDGCQLSGLSSPSTVWCLAPSIIVLHVVLREQGIDLVNLLVIINIACNRRSQAKRDHRTGSIRKPIPIHFKQQATSWVAAWKRQHFQCYTGNIWRHPLYQLYPNLWEGLLITFSVLLSIT